MLQWCEWRCFGCSGGCASVGRPTEAAGGEWATNTGRRDKLAAHGPPPGSHTSHSHNHLTSTQAYKEDGRTRKGEQIPYTRGSSTIHPPTPYSRELNSTQGAQLTNQSVATYTLAIIQSNTQSWYTLTKHIQLHKIRFSNFCNTF